MYEAISSLPDYEDPELKEVRRQVVSFLLRILAPYGLSEEDALHVVRGFRSMVHGFASLEHRNGFRMGLERDESLRRLLADVFKRIANSSEMRSKARGASMHLLALFSLYVLADSG